MSNAVYPTLAGLSWNSTKTPLFSTKVQTSVNLTELRASMSSAPIYDIVLAYDLLRDNSTFDELHTILGFFMARYGSWDSFLYLDPDDNLATSQSFGIGDGTTTVFQLQRSLGFFAEKVCNLLGAATLYVGGVLQTSGYTINATGLVTFTVAPANGQALTWSGSYYYRCRFDDAATPFALNQFMTKLWELKAVQFRGTLGQKL